MYISLNLRCLKKDVHAVAISVHMPVRPVFTDISIIRLELHGADSFLKR